MEERRKFERFGVKVPAKIEIPTQEGKGETLNLETDSLSAGGIYLKVGRTLPEGSPVKVEVALLFEELKSPADPDGRLVIAATGHVVRSGPEGMAIRFNEDYEITPKLNVIRHGKE